MHRNEVKEILKSPSVRLLTSGRSQYFIFTFFIEVFAEQTTLPEEKILRRLADYIEFNKPEADEEYETKPFDSYSDRAKKYLKIWTEDGYLTNYEGERGEYFYELSVFTEKTLQWLDSLKKKEFVGTESKFRNIFQQLQELVEFTNEDKEKRLQELRNRKADIEKQIQAIEMGESVIVFDAYQIKSRLSDLSQSAKELLSDFKEVEDNFKTITQEIHKKHSSSEFSKGNILSFTFDAVEQLRMSEQGKSFYAFWEFLLTQTKQNQWNELVNALYRTIEDRGIDYTDDFLKRLKSHLHKSGHKVYEANEKMAEKLSRIIGERENEERQKIKSLLKAIKANMLKTNELDTTPTASFVLEGDAEISLQAERNLTLSKTENVGVYAKPQSGVYSPTESETLGIVYNQVVIDRNEMRRRIKSALTENKQISLAKVIERNGGITKGLAEVFAYLSVLKEFKTVVDTDSLVEIQFDAPQDKIIVVPLIIITK